MKVLFSFMALWAVLLWTAVSFPQTPVKCSQALPCSVFWNANTEPDIKDYRLYLRKIPALHSATPLVTISHPQTAIGTVQLSGAFGALAPGQYALAVTARDITLNESAKSAEVFFEFVVPDLPPAVPTLNIFGTTIP